MVDYQNAISDRLIVLCRPDRCGLLIASKSSELKFYDPDLTFPLDHEIKGILSASIFAQTTVVHADMPFALCPSGLSRDEQALHLELNTKLGGASQALSLGQGMDMIFEPHALDQELLGLLVEPQTSTDLLLYHQYKSGLGHRNALYFTKAADSCLIRLYSGNHLMLAQRYPANSDEELLYHLANVLEQLKVDKENLMIEYHGAAEDMQAIKPGVDDLFAHLLILDPSEHLSHDARDGLVGVSIECV